jgi:hypothetical protein
MAEENEMKILSDRPLLLKGRSVFKSRTALLGEPAKFGEDILEDLNAISYPAFSIEFPPDFYNSTKERFLQVIKATVLQFDRTVQPTRIIKNENLMVCSNLVQEDNYCDYFLCFANQIYSEDKVIPIYHAKKPFQVMIKDEELNVIDLDPAATRVVLEFKLIY